MRQAESLRRGGPDKFNPPPRPIPILLQPPGKYEIATPPFGRFAMTGGPFRGWRSFHRANCHRSIPGQPTPSVHLHNPLPGVKTAPEPHAFPHQTNLTCHCEPSAGRRGSPCCEKPKATRQSKPGLLGPFPSSSVSPDNSLSGCRRHKRFASQARPVHRHPRLPYNWTKGANSHRAGPIKNKLNYLNNLFLISTFGGFMKYSGKPGY